eukprot:CAMPEP_0194043232 /NCGR_PEP_ID=MMETSP0009_2-20130614/14899_1 /TAXON_ID=210454 /ORGANISM="Grammatophora oceanica, Strain CCMP 410" /LENGTH=280 /DNA_ID=CAMNT_0038687367 /DNA_START=44 /DNA_END=886 /DNA_ORIENTATION=-
MSKAPSQATILAIAATVVAVSVATYLYNKRKESTAASSSVGPSVKTYEDKATVSKELCAFVAATAKTAIEEKGSFHLAVAGGSLLDALAGLVQYKDEVDFSKVVLSFANHKCVAPTDAKATLAKSKKKFADAAGIVQFVAPIDVPIAGSDGSTEAAYYAEQLKAAVPEKNGYPVLDLVLLGLGSDGHVGSCHPMGPAVAETTKTVAGSPKTGEPSSITLTIESMNNAKQVAFCVCGGSKGKKEAVKRAMVRPAEEPRGTFPAQLLASPIFFLDKEAAADL